ncbi:MAG: DsrE family protein [Deltaproteobacteria bacterium]|nr:DsrE family protein [Deltaproteobacteria bacterium]MBW2071078.1 DsrE family protein [Deltaproteobacteria bacterium]
MSKMVFIISNGFEKAGRATRAFQFAKVACEKGHDVSVFLVDDAIHWVQFGMAEGARASTGEEMKPFIDYLIEHDAPIYACKA